MSATYRNAEAELVDRNMYWMRTLEHRSLGFIATEYNVTPQRIAARIKRYRIRHKLEK